MANIDNPEALMHGLDTALQRLGGITIIRPNPDGNLAASISGYDKVILVEAGRSAQRAIEGNVVNCRLTEAGSSVAAILCAAVACETWLSEYLSRHEAQIGLPQDLGAIREIDNAHEQWRKLLQIRAPSYQVGESREYEALGCLIQLRNTVAHRNARNAKIGSFPDRIADCVRQRFIPARRANNADWVSVIFVHEVATWAFETALAWITIADETIPDPGFPPV